MKKTIEWINSTQFADMLGISIGSLNYKLLRFKKKYDPDDYVLDSYRARYRIQNGARQWKKQDAIKWIDEVWSKRIIK